MPQGTQSWSPSQGPFLPIGYNEADEHSMPIWPHDPNTVPSMQHPTSPLDMLLHQYPPYPQYLSNPGDLPYTIEGQDDMGRDPSSLLSQELDTKPTDLDQFYIPQGYSLGTNLHPLCIPDVGVAGPLMSPTSTIAASPQSAGPCIMECFSTITESPQSAGPRVMEYYPSLESPDIKLPDTTDGDEDSQPDVSILASALPFLPTSQNVYNSSNQTFVESSASGLPTIKLEDVEDCLKVVGSTQIQQAAGRRRKKDAIHECPFRNARNAKCNATFTARHNLRYHVYAHLKLKPYKCDKCTYAASSPATTKRHRSTCKGTNHSHLTEIKT